MVGAFHQEAAQQLVSRFGDPELGLPVSGVFLPGTKAEIGTNHPRPPGNGWDLPA
jgi:hypothetical protein